MKIIRSCKTCIAKTGCRIWMYDLTNQEKIEYGENGLIYPLCPLEDAPVRKDTKEVAFAFEQFVNGLSIKGVLETYWNDFVRQQEYQSIPEAKKPEFPTWTEVYNEIGHLQNTGYEYYQWLKNWYEGIAIPETEPDDSTDYLTWSSSKKPDLIKAYNDWMKHEAEPDPELLLMEEAGYRKCEREVRDALKMPKVNDNSLVDDLISLIHDNEVRVEEKVDHECKESTKLYCEIARASTDKKWKDKIQRAMDKYAKHTEDWALLNDLLKDKP